MKKYFYYAISALLMATSVITTSCRNDDDSLNEIQSGKPTITHWVEPYHVKDGTVEDAKAYMSDAMNRYALSGETSNSSSIQLRYTTGVNDEGVLYSFTKHTGSLYSIIDTELVVNSDIIFKYLNDKYDEVPGAYKNEARLQYTFTNQDKSMVITTVRVSDVCFNIDYSFISK